MTNIRAAIFRAEVACVARDGWKRDYFWTDGNRADATAKLAPRTRASPALLAFFVNSRLYGLAITGKI